MNNDVKAKWIEALRSGDFGQAKGKLKDEDGCFCCLGVLSNLYIDAVEEETTTTAEWVPQEPDNNGDVEICFIVQKYGNLYKDKSTGILCNPVREWAGLVHVNPEVLVDGKVLTLASLNDSGDSFEEIATLIEEQF